MKDDYSKSVSLFCPICGNDQFESEESDINCPVTCVSCKQVFSREELQEYNQSLIDNAIDEIKDEVVSDLTKDIKKIFKNLGRR